MPGVTLNVGKRGVSTSIGRRGAHITFGQNGVRTTVGIPGTGISYTSLSKPSHAPEAGSREASWPHLAKCPYCGHGMRKRWDQCPACHQVLEQPLPEDAVRCRGCGRVYEGNMLRFCPACGCRLLDTPVEILPELTAEERAVCGGALRGVSALPWSGAGCRGAEVLPALRLRGLDKEESAGVLGKVLLLSLCGDPDDRTFCHDVGYEKSVSCFTGEPLECCCPLLVCESGGAGSIGSEGSTGLVRCFSSS